MFNLVRHGAVAVALSAVVGIPAYSQIIDTAAVEAACVSADAGEADCLAAVEAFIAGLAGVPAAQADVALGDLAAILATASLSGGTSAGAIAAALETIVAAVSDPAQAAQIASIAVAVETGSDLPVFAVEAPMHASPA